MLLVWLLASEAGTAEGDEDGRTVFGMAKRRNEMYRVALRIFYMIFEGVRGRTVNGIA